jgi:hypothetical protein
VRGVGDVGRLAQVRAADATLAAAENPGGGAGSMVGAGVGLALGQQMAGSLASAATPPPIGVLFHMEANGQATGPFNLDQLRAAASTGQLRGTTLVWTQGMAGWAPASSVAQLAGLFATPPPIPPPPVPSNPSTPPPPPAQ